MNAVLVTEGDAGQRCPCNVPRGSRDMTGRAATAPTAWPGGENSPPDLTSSCNNAEAVPHEEKDIYVIGLYPSPYHIFLQGKAVCVENVFPLCWTCRDMLSPGFGCRFYDISFNWIIHSRKDGVSFF